MALYIYAAVEVKYIIIKNIIFTNRNIQLKTIYMFLDYIILNEIHGVRSWKIFLFILNLVIFIIWNFCFRFKNFFLRINQKLKIEV